MQIFKSFTFDSAHFLPHVPKTHKCHNVHGHTYKLTVYFEGPLDERLGWVLDFAEIKKVINPILKTVDHRLLNDIKGLENPTCENLAKWLWDKIKPQIPQLHKVRLHENMSCGAIYNGH